MEGWEDGDESHEDGHYVIPCSLCKHANHKCCIDGIVFVRPPALPPRPEAIPDVLRHGSVCRLCDEVLACTM